MSFVDHPGFAGSDTDAQARFQMAKKDDPFPEIEPSLLNSADIHDYVRMTGMLHPFHLENLKSASYEAAIAGQCIWWDERGVRHEERLEKEGQEFTLNANSIAFVQVEPFFRLPDYIALRFNLKITHVHRGILLGTGPLVDPGFEGRLLIPLHNLTLNPYTFSYGEGLIWVEFTKTSPVPEALQTKRNPYSITRQGKYKEFPPEKKYLAPAHYLHKASPHSPIRSSIPAALLESRDQAVAARKIVQTISAIGFIGLLALGITTWALIQDTWRVVDDVRHQRMQEVGGEQKQADKVDELKKQLQALDKRVMEEMAVMQQRLDKVRAEMGRARTSSATIKQQERQGSQSRSPSTK